MLSERGTCARPMGKGISYGSTPSATRLERDYAGKGSSYYITEDLAETLYDKGHGNCPYHFWGGFDEKLLRINHVRSD